MQPRPLSPAGGWVLIAEAAILMQLKVPTRFTLMIF
jgi:hypothetical protein